MDKGKQIFVSTSSARISEHEKGSFPTVVLSNESYQLTAIGNAVGKIECYILFVLLAFLTDLCFDWIGIIAKVLTLVNETSPFETVSSAYCSEYRCKQTSNSKA